MKIIFIINLNFFHSLDINVFKFFFHSLDINIFKFIEDKNIPKEKDLLLNKDYINISKIKLEKNSEMFFVLI